ncbi:hypothetical protein V496_08033 [Pseudogymnoascus sp. VKM F-4515 (FW-2607)]|nr:hypothetical protein V496_08033 [Pseudogymnoascus sp. VKM F-4515 (FW-2607)]
MGSDGTDVWGSALDTPNPAPNDEENTSHDDTHSPDALSASQQRVRPRSLSPTPSPSPTYPRPRSPSPDPDPDFNIELEGLKLSGGTPTTRSPAFGSAVGMGESRFVEPLKRDGGRYRDNDREGEVEEDDEGPGLDLLTEVVGEGYRDEEEDEGPREDILVSPKEK